MTMLICLVFIASFGYLVWAMWQVRGVSFDSITLMGRASMIICFIIAGLSGWYLAYA